MRRDNRGLTLIELIVTVAIIAIFSGVVVNFITIGSTSYQSTSKTTRVQMDAQEVLNEIQNLIIDTNRGVYYAYGTEANVGEEIWNDIDGEAVGSRVLFFCSEEQKSSPSTSAYMLDVLQWSADEQKLYYTQYQKEAQSSGRSASSAPALLNGKEGNGEKTQNSIQDIIKDIKFEETDISKKKTVLAEGVTGFHADIRKAQDNGSIRFQIMVDNSGKEVATHHTVNMRNTVQVVSMDNVFSSRPAVGNANIEIIKWPSSIEAGTSDVLRCRYENIDETSIRWNILDGKGELSEEIGMSVKLFAGDKGLITVQVSASTLGGTKIVSDKRIISINELAETIMELEPSRKEIYVAAGTQVVDLKTAISWRQGEENVAPSDLTYSSEMPHLQVNPESGMLSVDSEAIYSACINVTSKTTGVTGSLLVHIARISLDDPGHTHYTGDKKPDMAWKYIIDGEIVNLDDEKVIKTFSKDNSPQNYVPREIFLIEDISDSWMFKVSYEMDGDGYYGKVEDSKEFAVKQRPSTVKILIGGDENNDVLPASDIKHESYTCGRYNYWGIQAVMPENIPHDCEMKWEITGMDSPDTKFSNDNAVMSSNDGDIRLTIGEHEKTFTIKVTISHNSFATNMTDTKTINVLHDIEIRTSAEKDKDGIFIFHPEKEYDLNVVYHIGEGEIIANAENSVFDEDWTLNHYGKLEDGKYTPYENYTYGEPVTGTFTLQKIKGLFFDLWINRSFNFKVEHEISES